MLLSLSYRAVLMPFLPGTQGGNPTALSVVSAFRLVLLVASGLWLLPNFLPMIFFFQFVHPLLIVFPGILHVNLHVTRYVHF